MSLGNERTSSKEEISGSRCGVRGKLTSLLLALILLAGGAWVVWQFYGMELQRTAWGQRIVRRFALKEHARIHETPTRTVGSMPGMDMPDDTAGAKQAVGEARAIFIAPQRQQLIGVQTAPATLRLLSKEIRTVGKIAYDETKVTHIHTKVNGWIEQVFVC